MVYLIAGEGTRKPGSRPARELYASAWFQAAADYVARHMGMGNDRWFVLTPSLGMVRPAHVLNGESLASNRLPAALRDQWVRTVLRQLRRAAKTSEPLILLGSGALATALRKALPAAGYTVLTPLRGTNKPRQIAWFRAQLRPASHVPTLEP